MGRGNGVKRPKSVLKEFGFKSVVDGVKDEVRELYLADEVPWVVGYSGGKDSTAVLQLVWTALQDLPAEQRKKPVHVISTDTLVENPVVAAWVNRSLEVMKEAAENSELPFVPHRLTPEVHDTFWVNLIGRGYPAPRHKFRWCTERLKIKPSNQFIMDMVRDNGEAILVLGTRKAESTKRASHMKKHERRRVRDRLSPNANLPNSLVYTPVEDWSNDDVWLYLMQVKNPWGYNNKNLLSMYRGATADNECPLVVDTSTPSCGDSRFGCWVCTLVDQDKSMSAMIQNDAEKEWMLPLLELRNELDVTNDKPLRDFRRMTGKVQLFHDQPIHGPYLQNVREDWLRKVLEVQEDVRGHGPPDMSDIELISLAELEEIRRIWVIEKHELEDAVPRVFEEVTGEAYPGRSLDDNLVFGAEEMEILREACGDSRLHFEMTRELLDVTRQYQNMVRRAGLYEELEKAVRRHFFDDEADAVERERGRRDRKSELREKKLGQVDPELQPREEDQVASFKSNAVKGAGE